MSLTGVVVSVDPSEAFTAKRNTSWMWWHIDGTGQRMLLEADKHTIMRRVQIHSRDLRILDPNISTPSTILCREMAILLNLEHIKLIITAQEVFLQIPPDENVIFLAEELQRRLHVENRARRHGQADWQEGSEIPFEFRAFEMALKAICSFFEATTTELETIAYPDLDELTSKISSRNLDKLRQSKSTLTKLIARVQKVRDELEALLDDDDDMAQLYLSRKLAAALSLVSDSDEPTSRLPTSPTRAAKISRAKSKLTKSVGLVNGEEYDIDEIEMLLEAYFMKIDSTLNKLTVLREWYDNTEDYISMQLDSIRNELIKFEIILSVGSLCVSVYSLVTAILGMNIPFSWNTREYMFKWVVSVTGTVCAVLFGSILWYARFKRLLGT